MTTRERMRQFFNDTNAKKTQFCQRVNMSPGYMYRYLKGDIEISKAMLNRINAYLDEVYTK